MKTIKKIIVSAAALGIIATSYYVKTADFSRMKNVAGIVNEVIMKRKDFERTLIDVLAKTGDEETANGMIEKGYLARKRINAGMKPADGFAQNPYDLRIVVEHSLEGDKTYLADTSKSQKLPIYADNQVGDFRYRIGGLYSDAKNAAINLLGETKKTALGYLDNIVGGF